MEVEEEVEGEEGYEGTLRELGAIEFLIQEAELSGTAIIVETPVPPVVSIALNNL